MVEEIVLDVVSLIGAFLILLDFIMVTQKRWTPTGLWFNLTNFVASAMLLYVAVDIDNLGFIILNIFGVLVSTYNIEKLRSTHGGFDYG